MACAAPPDWRAGMDMIDLDFAVLGAEMEPHAAAPMLLLKLRVTNASPAVPVQNVMLQCQIRIEPTRRQYAPSEHEPLSELFGTPNRWGVSLHSLLWTYVNVLVPPFDTGCTFNLPVACSYDLNIAATKYFLRPRRRRSPARPAVQRYDFLSRQRGPPADRAARPRQGGRLSVADTDLATDDGPLLPRHCVAEPEPQRVWRVLPLQTAERLRVREDALRSLLPRCSAEAPQ
jgi:hypothetical protein